MEKPTAPGRLNQRSAIKNQQLHVGVILTANAFAKATSYPQCGPLGVEIASNLLTFIRAGNAKTDAAIFICLCGGGKIEVRERNLLGVLRRKVPKRLFHDRVILHFQLVLIAENKNRRRNSIGLIRSSRVAGSWRCRSRRRRCIRGGSVGRVGILIGLLAHSLLVEALGIHLVCPADLVLLILIIRRIRIPPPVRVDAAIKPGISVTPGTTIAVAVISEAVVPETLAAKISKISRG